MADLTLAYYSTQSKCFTSNIKHNKYNFEDQGVACHKFECNADATQVTILFPNADNK